nr:GATA zinc finger domain-containing protein 14-like [Penaeus vannamei]
MAVGLDSASCAVYITITLPEFGVSKPAFETLNDVFNLMIIRISREWPIRSPYPILSIPKCQERNMRTGCRCQWAALALLAWAALGSASSPMGTYPGARFPEGAVAYEVVDAPSLCHCVRMCGVDPDCQAFITNRTGSGARFSGADNCVFVCLAGGRSCYFSHISVANLNLTYSTTTNTTSNSTDQPLPLPPSTTSATEGLWESSCISNIHNLFRANLAEASSTIVHQQSIQPTPTSAPTILRTQNNTKQSSPTILQQHTNNRSPNNPQQQPTLSPRSFQQHQTIRVTNNPSNTIANNSPPTILQHTNISSPTILQTTPSNRLQTILNNTNNCSPNDPSNKHNNRLQPILQRHQASSNNLQTPIANNSSLNNPSTTPTSSQQSSTEHHNRPPKNKLLQQTATIVSNNPSTKHQTTVSKNQSFNQNTNKQPTFSTILSNDTNNRASTIPSTPSANNVFSKQSFTTNKLSNHPSTTTNNRLQHPHNNNTNKRLNQSFRRNDHNKAVSNNPSTTPTIVSNIPSTPSPTTVSNNILQHQHTASPNPSNMLTSHYSET